MGKIYYMENFERLGEIYIYTLQGWNLYRKIWVVGKPAVVKERRLDDRKQQGVKTLLCAFRAR